MRLVIETSGLQKSFKTRGRVVEAVRSVDLGVREGEIFGLLGPNGAGKTTTLRMLATLASPTAGEAMIAGIDLGKEPERVRQKIGYVSQTGGVDPTATGRENLMLQAQLYGRGNRDAAARTKELISTLELTELSDRLAKTYSGGERRRLDLAMGLVHEPSVLFLDEPTTGLDPQSRSRVWEEVRKLRDVGTTILITTHYMDEADALCERLAIVDDGQIVIEGTPEELKQRISGDVVTLSFDALDGSSERTRKLLYTKPFVREIEKNWLPTDNSKGKNVLKLYVHRSEHAMPSILRLVEEAGIELQSISLSRPTLDDVFLKQTGRSLNNREEETTASETDQNEISENERS